MEFSNKLLLSLKHDLKVLNRISEEISQKLSFFKLNSWLYPTKSYQEVSESHLHSKEKYLGYLELIIDKLYLIINLSIKYTEIFPTMPEEPKSKNVVRPSNLSLGASADLLWKKLLQLNDVFIAGHKKVLKKNSQQEIFNKCTQTDSYSSGICRSCAIAMSCMKEILNELEMNMDTNVKVKPFIRKDLQDDIYDITQNGCMNRLTIAITEDIKSLVHHLQIIEKQNKESSRKLGELTVKYGESLKIIRCLEGSLGRIRKRLRNVKLKNTDLTKKMNGVLQVNQDNEYKLLQARSKITTLEKSVHESTISLALFSTDNERLLKDIQQALNENVSASSERDMWKSRFSEIYLENRELKNKMEVLETEIEATKKGMDKIGRDCDKLCEKIEQRDIKIVQRTEMFEKLLKSSMDIASSKQIRTVDTVAMFDNKASKLFQITGDPIADMLKQIEINNSNISTLQRHNTNLLKTIHRVQQKNGFIKYS